MSVRKKFLQIIREALQSGDGTLRLLALVRAGMTCLALAAGAVVAARYANLL
ncbi:hypothetical protein [Streptomyces sp. TRM49041]|uniref:hypothetical protein n=1 Tax=Streptomyces sp. TRM49041 TaxID=2603216 RepID=UPI0016568A04|nr:hypothetical protein [Streptomyces sp. TRM49041]